MKLKKSIFSCLIATFLLMTLFASASQTAKTSPPSPTSTPKVTNAKPEWEQKWQVVLDGAKKEGSVRLYGLMGTNVRAELLSTFKDKFGVNLEIVSGAEGELIQKLTAERQTGTPGADLYMGAPEDHIYLKPKGYLVPLAPFVILPDVKNPKNWTNGKLPMFDKDGTAIALLAGYSAYILINKQMISENEIQSYEDLLKPQYKSKMLMFDPTLQGGSGPRTFINYVIPRIMGLDAGAKYLRELVKQDITYTRDARLQVEWVARGKFPITIGPRNAIVSDFIAAGSPLYRVRPKKGGGIAVSSNCLSIVRDAPHPNAATLFLNWSLTEEGQRIIAKGKNYPPRRLGVPFESSDQFAVVRPGEDISYETDETFYLEGAKTENWAKDFFGPVVGK